MAFLENSYTKQHLKHHIYIYIYISEGWGCVRHIVGEVCDIFEDQRVCQVPADINVICDGRYCKYQAEL